MIIIIDGYNLLHYVFPGAKGKRDNTRELLIRQMGYYKKKRSPGITQIIIVFDAGPFGHASREIRCDIIVMFSGQKSSADDWIIDYVGQHKNDDLLVVSMDRKLVEACESLGAISLGSVNFYALVQQAFLVNKNKKEHETGLATDLEVYDTSQYGDNEYPGDIDKEVLDFLMEQSSVIIDKKKDDELPRAVMQNKKGASSSLSRKDKKVLERLKKL